MKRWASPLGKFDVEVGDYGLRAIHPLSTKRLPSLDPDLTDALNEHLEGRPAGLKLDLQGLTPLTQVTLAKLLEIPFGEVRSYSWVAREVGRPTAIRPVAAAVAGNPLPLVIPCHRVIRSDGHIGEYSFGSEGMKQRVLRFEGLDIERTEDLARRRIRFLADKETRKFHLPSCHKGPVADSPTLIELKSHDQATELKLDACRACRPAQVHQ